MIDFVLVCPVPFKKLDINCEDSEKIFGSPGFKTLQEILHDVSLFHAPGAM